MDQKFHAAFFCSPVEKNGKNVYFKGLYYARCSMTFNKRILIKPAIILLAALLALGYSLRKERTDDPVPEIAEMKRLLRDAAPGDASLMKHYTSADSALFRRKLYAEARRLNGVMRKAEKKTSAIPAHFFDFSDYMSYIGERSFDRALEVLDKIRNTPGLPPRVYGAVLGERVRCIAELRGTDAAVAEFDKLAAGASVPVLAPAYNTFINVLHTHKRTEEAFRRTVEAGDRIPVHEGEISFFSRLGADLVRNGEGEPRLAALLPPDKRVADYTAALLGMADALAARGESAKADALLTRCLARPEFPENLKQITRMKLNIIREKKKETVK